jgi:hypothetical protein
MSTLQWTEVYVVLACSTLACPIRIGGILVGMVPPLGCVCLVCTHIGSICWIHLVVVAWSPFEFKLNCLLSHAGYLHDMHWACTNTLGLCP